MYSHPLQLHYVDILDTLKDNKIMIPQKISSIWNVKQKQSIHIQYHFFKEECVIEISENILDKTMFVSKNIAEKLHIPLNQRVQCFYDQEEKTFHFGPSIGMVIGEGFSSREQMLGTITNYAQSMAIKARELYLPFFVFSFQSTTSEIVHGYQYDGEKWENRSFPLPHVVYNRIGRRDQENSSAGKEFFHMLKKNNIPYFNHCFINKWDSYKMLSEEPTLAPYLPKTIKISTKENFLNLFDEYDQFYLKPCWGKEGIGIMSIAKEKDSYYIQYPLHQESDTKSFKKRKSIYQFLKYKFSRRQYIAQPRINTILYHNAPVDFRVLCIKDHYGEWRSCSAVARIGNENNIVTNLSQGGTQVKPRVVLNHAFDENRANQIERLLHELAIHAAESFDLATIGQYGELGFDFMIDQDGRIYILEVNIKPSKGDSLQSQTKMLPSIKYVLSYASSLTRFVQS